MMSTASAPLSAENDSEEAEVQVRTGARLHFGLIDLSGKTHRVDGGCGVSIEDPRLIVRIARSDTTEVRAPASLTDVTRHTIELCRAAMEIPPVLVVVESNTIPHVGLGSTTQCALAIARGLFSFLRKKPRRPLPSIVGRAGTSGIGSHSFERGGLIVDGGRAWPTEKSRFGPSSSFSFDRAPPLVSHLRAPAWGICVAIPTAAKRISGGVEKDAFAQLTPIPVSEVEQISRVVLMELLPAAAGCDFRGFCEAMEAIQRTGFKARQWETADRQAHLAREQLGRHGFRGIGLSSWGPAVFAFAPSVEETGELSKGLQHRSDLAIITTTVRNRGAEVTIKAKVGAETP
jgi:beta-ribofuranosylaminobenzene 5'-phosphate synthase